MMDTRLYLVPTPIGNLEDITYRAVNILKSVDVILAEDTRHSKRLLLHYEIETPMRSFHMHNEHKIVDAIIEELKSGKTMALVSDAGSPGISDPGYLLARACIDNKVDFESIPGPTAFVPALVLSGMAAHSFTFEGFLPVKKGRKTAFERLATENRTIILYESPHKLLRTLKDIQSYWGNRRVSVSRELTKKFEETRRATIEEHLTYYDTHAAKGEFVLVVEGASTR